MVLSQKLQTFKIPMNFNEFTVYTHDIPVDRCEIICVHTCSLRGTYWLNHVNTNVCDNLSHYGHDNFR